LPLPDPQKRCKGSAVSRLIFLQELRSLLLSPALWGMYIIVSLLVGYSFIQAVSLFSQASKTALSYPELASGMNPLEGVFVPTFGAYYLCQTLLLPFIAIRIIGLDRYNGTQKLLLQLPVSTLGLCLLKLAAMGLVWIVSLLPAMAALILWKLSGGHVFWPELFCLITGHALYSLTIITLAMFAATVSDSLPTAAMLCLAATLGSWVLDFAASGKTGFMAFLGNISLAAMLRQFESGLLSSTCILSFLTLGILFFLLTVAWLPPGKPRIHKFFLTVLICCFFVSTHWLAQQKPLYLDVTENQRHSFSPEYTMALQQLDKPLFITIHLSPQDSRLHDLKNDVLGKLQRTVSTLSIDYADYEQSGLFDTGRDEEYGLIEYRYGNKQDKSYSNSQEEILPIIFNLANVKTPRTLAAPHAGFPIVINIEKQKYLFYCGFPFLFLGFAVYCVLRI